jgi:hypothetical protein
MTPSAINSAAIFDTRDSDTSTRRASTSRLGQPVRVASFAFSANATSHNLRDRGPW